MTYISQEAIGETIAEFCKKDCFPMTDLIKAIAALPAADVREVKRGK